MHCWHCSSMMALFLKCSELASIMGFWVWSSVKSLALVACNADKFTAADHNCKLKKTARGLR